MKTFEEYWKYIYGEYPRTFMKTRKYTYGELVHAFAAGQDARDADVEDQETLTMQTIKFSELTNEHANGDGWLAVDFSNVEYINSTDIVKLLRVHKARARTQCGLIVCNVQASVWGLFLVTGIDRVFRFAASVERAQRDFGDD